MKRKSLGKKKNSDSLKKLKSILSDPELMAVFERMSNK